MTDKIWLEKSHKKLAEIIADEIDTGTGRKILEFGSGSGSVAEILRDKCDYLACTDKDQAALEQLNTAGAGAEIVLIPDSELEEDCYFGRFHMVYTLFGFQDLPHLVDEIMRLRRLILKGGKMVIVGSPDGNSETECTKQLKRCGFVDISSESAEIEEEKVFIITARK